MVTTNIEYVPEESKTFTEAWNHPYANTHVKWWEVIKKELADINEQQVWCKTKKSLCSLIEGV